MALLAQQIQENADLFQMFPGEEVKIIKLVGYSRLNREQDPDSRYKVAKKPFTKGWQSVGNKGITTAEAANWIKQGGWIGLVIPHGYIVVDIDEKHEGKLIYHALMDAGYKFHAIETVRGFQFFFKDNGKIKSQDATVLMAGGF